MTMFNYSLSRKAFEFLAWINIMDCGCTTRYFSLIHYIHAFQLKICLDGKYSISYDVNSFEIKTAEKILSHFSEYITKEYFKQSLNVDKREAQLKEEEFFIYRLRLFLKNNLLLERFYDEKMYDVSDYKYLGQWGTTFFQAKYILTDFAKVYYKLLLITELYCENSETIKKMPYFFSEANDIQRYLDAGFVEVENYG